jgi:FkbM family methyltransferase
VNTIIRFLNTIRALRYFNLEGEVGLNGKTFRIPVLGGSGYANLDMSEPWMIELLKRLIPLGNRCFVDVGVNIGQTLLKLRCVEPAMDYVGIEPNAACVHYVTRLIKTNQFKGVRLLPIGISNRTGLGELNFYGDLEVDSMASTVEEFRGAETRTRRAYIPLFDWKQVSAVIPAVEISILKIDVEGGEWEVIDALSEEIGRHQPIIIMEILPTSSSENTIRWERQRRIQQRLEELSYVVYLVIKTREQFVSVQRMVEIPIHADENRCEYVMVPRVRASVFEEAIQGRS